MIGAGVVGLAAAARLSETGQVVLVEAHGKFGQETSSRNSEVVHSGIYYPVDSHKTRWCLEGRRLLYDFCSRYGVPAKKTGKVVVATSGDEEAYLERLTGHAKGLGVPCERVSGEWIAEREPLVRAKSGVLFPETGIVDSHELMARLEGLSRDAGALLAYGHRVTEIARESGGWATIVQTGSESLRVLSPVVVNAAGLAAAEISRKALGHERYEHRFCRGRYFSLSGKYRGAFRTLVYPVPQKDGLGVHVTVDLDRVPRLGPDVDWATDHRYSECQKLYDCDWEALRAGFVGAARRYFPSLNPDEAQPGLIGIRPKLFLDGKASPDFLVENHQGFIHCLGIESPGLTSSLAIAETVRRYAVPFCGTK